MRRSLLILCLLFAAAQAKSQVQQAVYMGDASWVRSTAQHGPAILPVTMEKIRMAKVIHQDKRQAIFKRKADPATRIIKTGQVIPVTETISFLGKKLTAPQVIEAAPLQTRDNAEFNISYTDKPHGFPGSNAYDFAEDNEHNIWISSNDGLLRYDGYHYFLYTQKNGLPEDPFVSIAYDQQERLWLASGKGVYFIRHDSIFSIRSNQLDLSTIACVKVQIDTQQKAWLSTKKNGAICIDGSSVRVFDTRCGLPDNYIMAAWPDKKGDLVLASHDSGVVIIQPNKMLELFNQPNSEIGSNIFTCIYEDEEGVWIGGFQSGFIRLGPADTLQYSVSGTYKETIYDIKKAPGGLWISDYGHAVCYFNKTTLLQLGISNGLQDSQCIPLFEDSFKNIWVSSMVTGFARINDNSFYLNNFENPAINAVRDIIPDNRNGKWIMTGGASLLYQKGSSVTTYVYKGGGFQKFRYAESGALSKDGTLWLSTYGEGLIHVTDPDYFVYHFSSLHDDEVISAVKKDADEKIWVCPNNFGLVMYDQKSFWHYTTPSGLLSDKVLNLFQDHDKKIYLSFADGLQRRKEQGFETFFIANSSFKDRVNSLFETADGTMLLGTNANGLLLLRNNKVYHLTTQQDLSSNRITTIIQDTKGKIWVSTDKAVESFIIQGFEMAEHNVFNLANGSYITAINTVHLDSSGIPYWSLDTRGDKKLVFNPGFLQPKRPPVFNITQVLVDDKALDTSEAISVLPNQKIGIHFTAISWGRENNLKIKYLLISNSGDTTEQSILNNGNILISGILPGSYQAVITAKDNNNIYYAAPLFIRINDYWYKRWWFRMIILGVLLSGVFLYFRRKANAQKRINTLLEKKVAEQTKEILEEKEEILKSYGIIDSQNKEKDVLIQEINHRVKNNLQFIAAMIEMQMKSDQKKDTVQSLRGTSRRLAAMSLVHEMLYDNKNVQGLSIRKYINELVDNLKEMAIDDEYPVNFIIEVEDLVIDSKTAISIGVIISELVSNSLKHAFENISSPEVKISLTKDPGTDLLQLLVSDNGNGVVGKYQTGKGLGSRLVDIFSRQLEGTYTIDHAHHFIYILNFKLPGT